MVVGQGTYRGPGVLLALDRCGGVREGVLACLQRKERPRQDDPDHRAGDQKLGEGESALIPEGRQPGGLHGVHRWARIMLTVTVLAAAAVVVDVNGWKVTATVTTRMPESVMPAHAVSPQSVMRVVRE